MLCCLTTPIGPQQKQPWVPLSVNLGVPLFCPTLCQLVCNNLLQQQCLTAAGQATWRAAQQQLQQRLVAQIKAADSSNDDANFNSDGTGLQADGLRAAAGGAGVAPDMCLMMTGVAGMKLPSYSLLFDGHSLLPVDVSSCLQAVQLW